MKIPDYPSNREADEETDSHCSYEWEDVFEKEAKSGDLTAQ